MEREWWIECSNDPEVRRLMSHLHDQHKHATTYASHAVYQMCLDKGTVNQLVRQGPRAFNRYRNVGKKVTEALALALEELGHISSAEEWLGAPYGKS